MKVFSKTLQLFCALLLISSSFPAASQPLTNTLKNHPAPYLALHGDDPVAWQTWNQQTVELAKKQNKILFLSIGYFSCHWCHVMQKESYKNEDIAQFLNEHFIPVKIDRELEPALDRELMDFTQQILGRGGWPLNVFISPSGYPIYSVLYSPADQFFQLINKLQAVWLEDSEKVMSLIKQEQQTNFSQASPNLDSQKFSKLINDSVSHMMSRSDLENGGFGDNQKFPSSPQLLYLIQHYGKSKDQGVAEFLVLTLDAMATRELHDHILGGFFRYTTDIKWHIPHFEKMLYDNANLAKVYLQAGKVLEKPEYLDVAQFTLMFMQQYMWHEEGAFVSSFSAVDENNVEGGNYLWSRSQIQTVLDADEADLINQIWNLDRPPELPAGNHPRFVQSLHQFAAEKDISMENAQKLFESSIAKLKQQRLSRVPAIDDKLLAGWNGLALSAFVDASSLFPESGFYQTSQSLRDFIVNKLWDGNVLARALTRGGLLGSAALEDYAYVAQGLYDWARLTDSEEDFKLAYEIVIEGWQKFYRHHAWYQGDQTLLASASGEDIISDSASNSPSAMMIDLSIRLANLIDDPQLTQTAMAALNRGENYLSKAPFWYVGQLTALKLGLEQGLPE